MKYSRLRKEKYKTYGSKSKGAPGSGLKLNPVFKDINGIKGVVTLGQDPTQLSLLFVLTKAGRFLSSRSAWNRANLALSCA